MSAAPVLDLRAARVPGEQALRTFAAACTPQVEHALAMAVGGVLHGAPALQEALADAVDLGGGQAHRWRPLLVLAAADACGARTQDAMDVAVAAELTHTASLVLDDLPCMDNAPMRRGRSSTHNRVGQAGAILIAVGLLARAVELIGRAPSGGAALTRQWGEAVGFIGMAGGQAMDLRVRNGQALNPAARRLYRRKTTALAAFSAMAGGMVARAPAPMLSALDRFGQHLGWAYQLRDDIADLDEDGRGNRLLALEQAAVRRARLVARAERAMQGPAWARPTSAEALAAAARRIAGVPAAALRDR